MFFKRQNENEAKVDIVKHFNFFKENIPYHLNIAKTWLNKNKLDFSLEEIDNIENYYRACFEKNQKKPGSWYDENYEVYVTYIGEAFISYFLGVWKINELKGTFGYGYPFIFENGSKEDLSNPVDPTSYLLDIENGIEEPLSVIFSRKIRFYERNPIYDFRPLENLKNRLEKDNP